MTGHGALNRRASVLVGVLWCVALLFVVVIGILHTSRIDLRVTKHHEDRIQAHYLALAGIEKAKAVIYHDARERSRNRKSHTLDVYDSPHQFRDIPFGRGRFSVFRRGSASEGNRIIYGVNDEESRLNVNSASMEDLAKLQGMTPDVAAAIIDWRDQDNAATAGGAELDYYASMAPPRRPRNGPFETVRELLLVRNMPSELLLGNDERQNGLIEDLEESQTSAAGLENPGWASILTVHSSVANVSAAGTERVNVQNADEAALSSIPGISTDLAKAITRYRNQRPLESIVDLLDVAQVQDPAQQEASRTLTQSGPSASRTAPRTTQATSPNPTTPAAPTGPKLISTTLFMEIADDVTTESGDELSGVMNLNSASLEALMCLPGISREMAQAIISHRQSSGFFPNIAHLLKIPGINQDLLKRLAPRISTRSGTYRIVSEGRVSSTGARQRIEEIVRITFTDARTLAYRENDL